MPLAIVVIGGFLVLLAVNGKYSAAMQLLGEDIKAAPGAGVSLLEAVAGLILIAAIFKLIRLPVAGEAFITLLFVVFMVTAAPNFLTQLEQAFGAPANQGSK